MGLGEKERSSIITFIRQQAVNLFRSKSKKNPSKEWEKVILKSMENNNGNVDYAYIEENRDILEQYMSWLGTHGPFSDKMRLREYKKKIAFLLNAYNAAVIYGVLENELHIKNESVLDVSSGIFPSGGAGFFLGQQFFIDGEWVDSDTKKFPGKENDGENVFFNLQEKPDAKYFFMVAAKDIKAGNELTANYNLYTYPKTGVGLQML